jgi:hypothetical protein
MPSSEPIVFALTRPLFGKRYVASLVSAQRTKDVTFSETSWHVKACVAHPIELTCGTLPLETVTWAEPKKELTPSVEDLIRYAGQNQTELYVTSPVERLELPVFLTTGQPVPACHYPIRFRLRTQCWADTPDFLAGQAFWIRHYQKLIANGQTYYEARLADYQREREVAAQLEIGTGDVLPVTVRSSARSRDPGCLLIGEALSPGYFQGTLCVLGEQDVARCKIERLVRWEESGKAVEADTVIAEIAN